MRLSKLAAEFRHPVDPHVDLVDLDPPADGTIGNLEIGTERNGEEMHMARSMDFSTKSSQNIPEN